MSSMERLREHLGRAERALQAAQEVAGIAQAEMQENADAIAADVQRALDAVSEAVSKAAAR